MRDHARIFWVLAALAVVLEIGSLSSPLNAQQTPEGSQAQQPSQPSQPPAQSQPSQQTPSTQSGQASGEQSSAAPGAQTFTGTIVKSGDKFVLQDTNGKTYDIDHQDLVGQHVGRRVRVQGTLDPDGKTIHLGK